MIDCVIIGAGPAGLTAALYLARYKIRFEIFDAGESRAAQIPLCRNFSTEPDGIQGKVLLARMRSHILLYGVEVRRRIVERVKKYPDGFRIATSLGEVEARTVLMATGKEDEKPAFADGGHDQAVQLGLLRYCPICDGPEAAGKHVAVLGTGSHGVSESLFLRTYASQIDLVSVSATHSLSAEQRAEAEGAGVRLIDGPLSDLRIEAGRIAFTVAGNSHAVDCTYAALGCRQRSTLASGLGADLSDDGCIIVDQHQQTSVPGLFAAGDVIVGLDQISTALGNGAIAATAIRGRIFAG